MKFNSKIYISNSAEQTEKIGEELSRFLKSGDIIFLKGNLGSGKTTFVKGLAKGLGISARIISPTFVIVREHKIENAQKEIKKLYHLDLYRLTSEKEVKGIDLEDFIHDKTAVVAIEWPEGSEEFIKEAHWTVNFKNIDDEKRSIEITYG